MSSSNNGPKEFIDPMKILKRSKNFDTMPEDVKKIRIENISECIRQWGHTPVNPCPKCAEDSNTEFTLLKVIADIREKTRVGDKVMLADLADTLAGLIQIGESAIETNKQLVKRLQQMKGV